MDIRRSPRVAHAQCRQRLAYRRSEWQLIGFDATGIKTNLRMPYIGGTAVAVQLAANNLNGTTYTAGLLYEGETRQYHPAVHTYDGVRQTAAYTFTGLDNSYIYLRLLSDPKSTSVYNVLSYCRSEGVDCAAKVVHFSGAALVAELSLSSEARIVNAHLNPSTGDIYVTQGGPTLQVSRIRHGSFSATAQTLPTAIENTTGRRVLGRWCRIANRNSKQRRSQPVLVLHP